MQDDGLFELLDTGGRLGMTWAIPPTENGWTILAHVAAHALNLSGTSSPPTADTNGI